MGLSSKFAGLPQYEREFDVKKYGARGDARMCEDGVLTDGSTTVTSATAAWTQADVGKTIWGTLNSGTLSLPTTTIVSVESAMSITIADASAAHQTSVHLVWGTDDTAAIQAAAAAANAASPKGMVAVPRGGYIFSDVLFNQSYGTATPTYSVQGAGRTSTIFYPSPDHVLTGGYLFNTAADTSGGFFKGFAIEGNSVTYSEVGGVSCVRAGSGMVFEDVQISRLRNSSGNMILVHSPASYAVFRNCHFEFSSGVGVAATGLLSTFYDCYNGNHGTNAVHSYAGNVTWVGGILDECGFTTVQVESTGRIDLVNAFVYAGAAEISVDLRDTSTLRAFQTTIGPHGGHDNVTALKLAAGAAAHLSQVTLTGSGTGYGLDNAGTVYDGGNNFTNSETGSGTITVPTL